GPGPAARGRAARRARQLHRRQALREDLSHMKKRFSLAALIAALAWGPQSAENVSAVYCYPGDPPAVYQACLAYNAGIGQQVNNENQLNSLIAQYNNAAAQINALDALIASLTNQIAAQRALIAQTQAAIDDLNMK